MPNDTRSALSWREVCLVFAAFFAASLVLTLPLALHPTRQLPSDLVDTLLNTWIIGWDADRIAHGLRGLWDSPIYFPYRNTLAFSENLLGIAWLVAPVYWISGNAVLTYNIAYWLSFTIAGVGMYLLARDLTGSRIAATVAGTAYAFCPFRFMQMSHIQMVCTGWLPLAVWALHRYFVTARRKWLAGAVAASALQALSNTYVAYYMAVPIVMVAIDGLVRQRDAERRRTIIDLAVAGALLVLLLAPVGAAYYHVRSDYRQVRSSAEIVQGGADVRGYIVALTGVWKPLLPEPVYGDSEKELFPGIFAPLLACAALWGAWKSGAGPRRWVFLYAGIALAGFLLSLGPRIRVWGLVVTSHGPYEWLQILMPGMDGMRVPSRFAIIFAFGLSMLAGCGAAYVLAKLSPRARAVALAVLVMLIVADSWAVPLNVGQYPGEGRPEDVAVAEWLRAAPPGAVLHLPIRTNNFQELSYQYSTLRHGHPLVNGFSGYNTPLQEFFREPRSPLYDFDRFGAAVRMLRRLGVRYVVMHTNDYSVTQQADLEPTRTLAGFRASGQIVREQELPGTRVFELTPWTDEAEDATAPSIPASEFVLTASEEGGRLSAIVDGDPDTRWIGRQEGSSWIEARFRKPRDVSQVDLLMARRSIEDFPRELQIDGVDDAGRTTTLYKSPPYAEFIIAFVRDPDYPRLSIRLPPNRSQRLIVKESAVYHDWWWSIHELGLKERSGAR